MGRLNNIQCFYTLLGQVPLSFLGPLSRKERRSSRPRLSFLEVPLLHIVRFNRNYIVEVSGRD